MRFGDADLRNPRDDNNVQVREILVTYRHPRRNPSKKWPYFDIAIWKVKPLQITKSVRPICLPNVPNSNQDKYKDASATVTGWGILSRSERVKNFELNFAPQKVYSQR